MTQLHRLLVLVLIQKVKAESVALRAAAQFEDMGYDECPTCQRARLRAAFLGGGDGLDA